MQEKNKKFRTLVSESKIWIHCWTADRTFMLCWNGSLNTHPSSGPDHIGSVNPRNRQYREIHKTCKIFGIFFCQKWSWIPILAVKNYRFFSKKKTKQNKTEKNRRKTKQNITKQNRTKQNRRKTKQNITKQNRRKTEEKQNKTNKTKQNKTKQNIT